MGVMMMLKIDVDRGSHRREDNLPRCCSFFVTHNNNDVFRSGWKKDRGKKDEKDELKEENTAEGKLSRAELNCWLVTPTRKKIC